MATARDMLSSRLVTLVFFTASSGALGCSGASTATDAPTHPVDVQPLSEGMTNARCDAAYGGEAASVRTSSCSVNAFSTPSGGWLYVFALDVTGVQDGGNGPKKQRYSFEYAGPVAGKTVGYAAMKSAYVLLVLPVDAASVSGVGPLYSLGVLADAGALDDGAVTSSFTAEGHGTIDVKLQSDPGVARALDAGIGDATIHLAF